MVTGMNPLSVLLLLLTAATPPVQHLVDEVFPLIHSLVILKENILFL